MLRRAWFPAVGFVLLAACSGIDEQAARHLVIAELIERQRVPESYIVIEDVRTENGQRARVKAKVLGPGEGRAGHWHRYVCLLERDGRRWVIRQIAQDE